MNPLRGIAYPTTLNELLYIDFVWMLWNIALATLPALCAYLLWHKKLPFVLQTILGLLWFLFIPNALYLITDIIHPVIQWPRVSHLWGIVIYLWFILILGYGVFIHRVSMRLMARFLHERHHISHRWVNIILYGMSMLIGLAIGMGRFARTNSWYVFTQPLRVVHDLVTTLTDPGVLLFSLAFGIGAGVLYRLYDHEY